VQFGELQLAVPDESAQRAMSIQFLLIDFYYVISKSVCVPTRGDALGDNKAILES
jgi:hypothetical protein